MYSIATENLTHHFGTDLALQDVNLLVPAGSIYGFLGPNGAGKTTTLRLILGLLKKQQGSISILGKPFHTHRIEILKRIGSLIETPSLYGHLTAVENLMVWQKLYRCSTARVHKVLSLVDLHNTGKKKTSRFSLGMKQRLSIAVALLNEPSLLILDEPTNGLDPNGIIEIRNLLKRLNEEFGISILVSSHLLSEIEKLVSHVGIINKGKLLFQGTLHELIEKQQQSSAVLIETDDISKSSAIIERLNIKATTINGAISVPALDKSTISSINRQLVMAGVEVSGISYVKNDLESVFMNLIK